MCQTIDLFQISIGSDVPNAMSIHFAINVEILETKRGKKTKHIWLILWFLLI